MDQTRDAGERDGETVLVHAERLLREGAAEAALALLEDGRRECRATERPYLNRLIGSALLNLGRRGEAHATLETALADPVIHDDDRAHALLLNVLGNVQHAEGRFQAAAERFGQALRYAELLCPLDHALCARLLVNLGVAALDAGQVEPATVYYERAAEAARLAGDRRRLGMAYMGLSVTREQARDYNAARSHAEEAVRLFEQAGEPRLATQARTNLATVYAEQGAWDVATPYVHHVLTQARASGDAATAAYALELLAQADIARGDYDGAAERAAEARAGAESAGDLLEAHVAGVTEAAALVALERPAEAERRYRAAIDYFRAVRASRHFMSASRDYVEALRSWGRGDEALKVLDQAYAFVTNLRQG